MKEHPKIETKRLTLRPYSINDAPDIQRLIGNRDIASTTLNVPHPYEDGMAEQYIQTTKEKFEKGEAVHFAIVHRAQHFFMGGISLKVDKQSEVAELGYWIAKPYWSQGYCTEAANAVLRYGFEVLELNRIQARHFTRNPTSGRVMQKIGMKHEGHLRQAVKKWGKFEDWEIYGILRSEW